MAMYKFKSDLRLIDYIMREYDLAEIRLQEGHSFTIPHGATKIFFEYQEYDKPEYNLGRLYFKNDADEAVGGEMAIPSFSYKSLRNIERGCTLDFAIKPKREIKSKI